jgi:hypothetical protein
VLRRGAALHATCLADGLAVFLTTRTAERADVIALLELAVSRLGSVDRAAFGFDADTPAPPECVEAWRAGRFAPVHCEEYPEAFRATREAGPPARGSGSGPARRLEG